jgi:hypothetical protein
MADGSTKPIKEVKVGDVVVTTDPATGKTVSRVVTDTHVNLDNDLTDLTVVTDSGVTGIKTTQHHQFWSETRGKWVEAADLKPGEHLRALVGGAAVMVLAVDNHIGATTMRDLTVDEIHAYYVLAGGEPVLVHNCSAHNPADETPDDDPLDDAGPQSQHESLEDVRRNTHEHSEELGRGRDATGSTVSGFGRALHGVPGTRVPSSPVPQSTSPGNAGDFFVLITYGVVIGHKIITMVGRVARRILRRGP